MLANYIFLYLYVGWAAYAALQQRRYANTAFLTFLARPSAPAAPAAGPQVLTLKI